MTTISITADVGKLTSALNDIQRTQIPFATALTLTAVARGAEREVTAALPSIFDRPNPFTLRAIGSTGASKHDLSASVFVKQAQSQYLTLEETGGVRTPAKTALVVPVDIRRNVYGNIPNRALARAKGRKKVFVGTIHGVGGFWERRPKHKLRLLAAFEKETTYKPRFGFAERVRTHVTAALPGAFAVAMARATASARPTP